MYLKKQTQNWLGICFGGYFHLQDHKGFLPYPLISVCFEVNFQGYEDVELFFFTVDKYLKVETILKVSLNLQIYKCLSLT